MDEIKIGVVGVGAIAQVHIQNIITQQAVYGNSNGVAKLVIAVDVDEAAAKATCEKFGFETYSTDWHDAIVSGINLLVVATPNQFHYDVTKAALEYGIHVLCEKPLTNCVEQSRELARIAKENNLVNYVGYIYVTSPLQVFVKDLIDTGKLGRITRVHGTFDYGEKIDENFPLVWRLAKKEAKGGALGDISSHVLSSFKMMLGDAKRVVGIQKTAIKERPLAWGSEEMGTVEADDMTDFLIEYENGVIGSIGCTCMGGGHRPVGIEYEIQGTKGTVIVREDSLTDAQVWFKDDDIQGFRKVSLGPYDAYSDHRMWGGYSDMMTFEYNKLFAALTHGEEYLCDFEFGIQIDEIIEAVQQSADTGRWVDVKTHTETEK
ncbi:MAG: Gfo/Idh/MocA family oxidoreductase [Eubacteriales bacterium]|nr:Gfo/Idh/MocA family oxidoreductase [Eubacteriales bacterium]